MGAIYAVCTGLILGLLSFEIIPEAIQYGNWNIFFGGFLAGVLLFKIIHLSFHILPGLKKQPNMRTGLLLTVIISIHNIPMGVILGSSQYSEIRLSLLQTLTMHNIPEGMILFTPLFAAGLRFFLLFFFSFVVAAPIAIGAFIGEVMSVQNNLLWVFMISLTIGTIYMVTVKEILPESIKHSSIGFSMLTAVFSFCVIGAYFLYI